MRNHPAPWPANPYAHLLGREAYPAQTGWQRWIGDRLNLPEVIIVRGLHNRRSLYALLRAAGVRVRRVGYQAATGLPWWQLWKQDTYIRVERYHGMATRDILEAEGYPLNE